MALLNFEGFRFVSCSRNLIASVHQTAVVTEALEAATKQLSHLLDLMELQSGVPQVDLEIDLERLDQELGGCLGIGTTIVDAPRNISRRGL